MGNYNQSGFFKRNETVILISAILFFGSLILSYFISGFLNSYLSGTYEGFRKSVSEGTIQLTTSSIFLNNLKVAGVIYLMGFSLGIFSVAFLVFQGAFTGFVAAKFNLSTFLIYTIPHGIFEITAIIISGAAGLRLATGFYHFLMGVTKITDDMPIINQLKYLIKSNSSEFIDSLKLFALAVILLIIAAFIEANLTITIGNYIQSII